jgi:hypothetical protein
MMEWDEDKWIRDTFVLFPYVSFFFFFFIRLILPELTAVQIRGRRLIHFQNVRVNHKVEKERLKSPLASTARARTPKS